MEHERTRPVYPPQSFEAEELTEAARAAGEANKRVLVLSELTPRWGVSPVISQVRESLTVAWEARKGVAVLQFPGTVVFRHGHPRPGTGDGYVHPCWLWELGVEVPGVYVVCESDLSIRSWETWVGVHIGTVDSLTKCHWGVAFEGSSLECLAEDWLYWDLDTTGARPSEVLQKYVPA